MTSPSSAAPSAALRSAIVVLVLAPLCAAQTAGAPEPLSHIQVAGLTDTAGAKVILLNAKGVAPNCRESVLLSPGDPDPWVRDYKANMFRIEIASKVDKGCWCEVSSQPVVTLESLRQASARTLAGLAVLAPGKAVAYYPNLQRFHSASRDGTVDVMPVNRLCPRPPQNEFVIEMRPKREVSVMVWASAKDHMLSMAKDDVANADWIFDKELAGITLRPAFHELTPQQTPPCLLDGNDCCNQVTESGVFDPGAINIYYGIGTSNSTCADVPVVFIHDAPILGDAAHELGHALGLFQSDNDTTRYLKGHTTNHSIFAWDNIMWEQTHFLKNKLSPGQAFWMSQSCSSFISNTGACLNCSDEPGSNSPCPQFALGHENTDPNRSLAAQIEEKDILIPRQIGHTQPASCDLPKTAYRSGGDIEDQLSARYNMLKKHVSRRPDLRLGAINQGEFLDHWEPEFALNLSGADYTARNEAQKKFAIIPPRLRGIRTDLIGALEKFPRHEALPACKTGPQ